MVTKTLIIIPKKREKEMISRMKFWCVRLRERGEMFTKMMENVVVNDHRDNLFWGFGKKFGKHKTLKSSILQGKSMKSHCFTQIYSRKRYFGNDLGTIWEQFGKRRKDGFYEKEKLQRTV